MTVVEGVIMFKLQRTARFYFLMLKRQRGNPVFLARGVAMGVFIGITPTIQGAIGSVRKGGSVTLVGNLSPAVEVPLQQVVTRQLRLYGSCASSGEYPACLDLIAKGKIDVEVLISERPPLSEGAMWFQKLNQKDTELMKVIFDI